MAQFRQSGGSFINSTASSSTSNGGIVRNGVASDHQQHLSIGIRSGSSHKQTRHHHHRRWKSSGVRKISSTALILFLLIAFFASVVTFLYLSSQHKEISSYHNQEDEIGNDTDFLINVTRTEKPKVLKFGEGSVKHGRDSRYWDRDDRRRDEDYTEENLEQTQEESINKNHVSLNVKNSDSLCSGTGSNSGAHHKNSILYNEAGRDELKKYEAEYEASLKSIAQSNDTTKMRGDTDVRNQNEMVDANDGYDDGIDLQDAQMDEDSKDGHENERQSDIDDGESSLEFDRRNVEEANDSSLDLLVDASSAGSYTPDKVQTKPKHVKFDNHSKKKSTPDKRVGKKPKRHRYSGSCEMKILNSSAQLMEPLETRKFARFSLRYTDQEEKPNELEKWETRFAGYQSLQEREESFIARDQKINCGFVKGPNRSSSGFDIAEDDAKYMSSCHIAVGSCIFGNSDRLKSPVGKMVSKLSKKNVCFVMFVDATTLQTLVAEGQILDGGFIGLWRVVVVKNLPYTDMRRVGKIPKFLSHRLFPSARYSIWLDSKLRLQLDPLLILELFLWRKGFEYAISNHYDRHCVWEEVAQNKRLNKYNHTVIDEQFAFYQADGLKRFDPADPQNLLPSNVPEGSLIIRAHTPMSNLFSCLWFNEVERFTPRDQLSFAYTYYKLRNTNPEKPFYLKMFKDCERRKIAKLYRHRSEDERTLPQRENE